MTYFIIKDTIETLTVTRSEHLPGNVSETEAATTYDAAMVLLRADIDFQMGLLRARIDRLKDCKLSIQTKSLTLVDDPPID